MVRGERKDLKQKVRKLVRSTDIFNYFTSLSGGPLTAIEEPMFLAPENIKAFNKAINQSKFRGPIVIALDMESGRKPKTLGSKPCDALRLLTISTMCGKNFIVDLKFWDKEHFHKIYGTIFRQENIIVGFHIREDITLVLTKFGYLCCVYDLVIVLAEMKDKSKTRMIGISPEAPSLKAFMTENINAEEEGTSEEPYIEVVSKIGSDEEIPETNVLPTPPVYAKAGGQNVENITNPEKFAKVMHNKRQAKEKRIAQEENKAEFDKVMSGNFQQPAGNPNDKIKY
uniref:3'-5' exonuclease domain-containing protein n=1 Tax=Romanomermis culicivorax TaxID=13658 RepID=A0A915KPQ1_ROMCU